MHDEYSIYDNNQLTDNEVNNIYKVLKTDPVDDIDLINDTKFIISIIEQIYPKDFLLIASEELQKSDNLLNNNFVLLLTKLAKEHNYKNVALIFITFCDYFSLEYNTIYTAFHEKIQLLIKKSSVKFIGSGVMEKMEKKLKPKEYTIITLTDLLKK